MSFPFRDLGRAFRIGVANHPLGSQSLNMFKAIDAVLRTHEAVGA